MEHTNADNAGKMEDELDLDLMTDPTEAELFRAYRNDLIENICKSLEAYQKKDGYIRMKLALKVIRSFEK